MSHDIWQEIEIAHFVLNPTLSICEAGTPDRLIWNRGLVSVNTWTEPSYRTRDVPADFGVAAEFFEWAFPVERERNKLIDWIAWNLQNEADKPTWAPLLYSEEKGSGKSTFCELVASLFGKENSVTQNNVKKLTARFNMTALQSKLVISEELRLTTDGPDVNALKTYITEQDALAERKGQEAVRIQQNCAFIFTTNHLPTWIEAGDRRFYVVEVNHGGHASGERSEAFAQVVGRLKAAMGDKDLLAAIYRAFMDHRVSDGFSAKHFNPELEATEIMIRLQGTGARIIAETLKERMAEKGIRAIRQETLFNYATQHLRVSGEMLRHLLPEMRLTKQKVKWGGVDHQRVIWVTEGCRVEGGRVFFENGEEQNLEEHLQTDLHSDFTRLDQHG